MISILSASNQEFANNLSNIESQLNTDELQISSGSRMNQVSDDPDQVSELLQARAAFSASQQILTNLGGIKAEVDTGETTMETAVQLFDQVQTLAAEGATGTQTAATRSNIAQQLQGIEQQFVGLADTNFEGRYIFSGDSDQTEPYTYDVTQPDPVSAYLGAPSTREALNPNGTTFPIALTAQQIFDSADPTTNVFGAINGLVTALQNNDQTAVQTSTNGLATVAQYMNNQLAFYGTTQDTVASATEYANTQQTALASEISSLSGTDVASTILNMTQVQTDEQAALASYAQLSHKTLFDFIA